MEITMKKLLKNKAVLIACLILSGICPAWASLEIPEPLITINAHTENVPESIIKADCGIAGGPCLDFTDSASFKPLVIEDARVLDGLSGINSLTITGWMRRQVSFDDIDVELPYMLNCPGHFYITFGRWGRVGLVMTGQDGRTKQLWSGWINITNLLPDDRWVFFAFTYDGLKSGPNAAFYYGYQQYSVELEACQPADSGQVNTDPDEMWTGGKKVLSSAGTLSDKPAESLVIGSRDGSGSQPFKGMLDNIRIFTSSADSSAALTRTQVEEVRQNDLGDEMVKNYIIEKADKELRQMQRQWDIEQKYWSDMLNLHQVDSLSHVYSDIAPIPLLESEPVSAARGAVLPLQFAAMSREKAKIDAAVKVSTPVSQDGRAFAGTIKTYKVQHVPVEANNNGGIRTTISSRPPRIWMEHITREAPFQLAEALIETDALDLRENNMHEIMYKVILLDIHIYSDCEPGIYKAQIELDTGSETISRPFEFRVHKTILNGFPRLNNVFWFKADPKNLTNEPLPEMWSPRHWELIENSARTLHSFGQNAISISLMTHRDETVNYIQTILKEDGSYDFDFTMFDRWYETFRRCGFDYFEGICTFGGHKASAQNVKALEQSTGKMTDIFTTESSLEDWYDFVAVFYDHLYAHLKERGWDKYYVQAILDEPTDMANYRRAYELTKKHMPGIKTKEACGNADYSDYIDIQVFNYALAKESYQLLAKERRSQGKGVWFYHCASPYPPYPNRHLDDPLSCSRLYPWLVYSLNADGYLFWAANNYRGADPYKSSIGPLPGGVTNPGHPPGDDWMYYPGPEGLRGSMRMVAFREGVIDYTLLDMLAEKDTEKADELVKRIVRTPLDYEKDPGLYHRLRREMLGILDSH
jgi:hypothetical protein